MQGWRTNMEVRAARPSARAANPRVKYHRRATRSFLLRQPSLSIQHPALTPPVCDRIAGCSAQASIETRRGHRLLRRIRRPRQGGAREPGPPVAPKARSNLTTFVATAPPASGTRVEQPTGDPFQTLPPQNSLQVAVYHPGIFTRSSDAKSCKRRHSPGLIGSLPRLGHQLMLRPAARASSTSSPAIRRRSGRRRPLLQDASGHLGARRANGDDVDFEDDLDDEGPWEGPQGGIHLRRRAVVRGDKLVVANAGDSRAVLSRRGEERWRCPGTTSPWMTTSARGS